MSGNDNPTVRKDMSYSPSSEEDTEELQDDQEASEALKDPAIDESRVVVLPGTGGPDDAGDITPSDSDRYNKG